MGKVQDKVLQDQRNKKSTHADQYYLLHCDSFFERILA